MSLGFNITEPFEQILKRLAELKKNPELFSEIANIFELIKQIEKYTNTATSTLQNYYLQFTRQVDVLSSLIDFQTKINYTLSHQEIVDQIFSFLKEHVPFQDAFMHLRINETNNKYEIVAARNNKKDQFEKFLTKSNINHILEILQKRDLGILISDMNDQTIKNVSWDLITASSIILFPIRMRGKLYGFGLLSHTKNTFNLDHLSFINLVSGFISQTVFHHFYFSQLKSKLFKEYKIKKEFDKNRYFEYLENGPMFIFSLDSNGIIIHASNETKKRLVGNEELIGGKFLSFIPKNNRKSFQNILNQMHEGDVKLYRSPLQFGPQNEYVLELYITKIQFQNNYLTTLIFGVDITQDYHKNLQSNRNEILDEITRFSQIINGYLENMLKDLVPTIELFKRSITGDELLQKQFQIVEKSIHQTSNVVQSFLKFKVGETSLRKDVNINNTIMEALKELKHAFLKNIDVKYSFDPAIPKMMTYPSKIKDLIKVFAQNSAEAIEGKGYFKVATKLVNVERDSLLKPNMIFLNKGKYAEIVFEDNGMGIDSRILPQIFKPFFSTKIRNDGIGLGLFVAYNIARDLEGEIFVRSKQNEYTKFVVYIPYKGDIEMQEVLPGMAEAIKERSPTVLVVDDEFNIRSMLKEVLEMNGYNVFTAANGQEGIDIFRKNTSQIDLIILDMVMPVMDGKQAFLEIKKLKKSQKVIIISGYAKKDDLREILNKGALAFMSKPFQIDSIVKKVKEFLRN